MYKDDLFRVVLIGDLGVGKSTLLSQLTLNQENEWSTTCGNKTVRAQLQDPGGLERFKVLPNVYYKGAVGALLVYDISNAKTFQNVETWLGELHTHAEPNIIIMLVGNKSDLGHQRAVPTDQAVALASKHELPFIETSALEPSDAKLAFEMLLTRIADADEAEQPATTYPQSTFNFNAFKGPSAAYPSFIGWATYSLDDWTNWRLYRSVLWRNTKVWLDHICWSLLNIILLVLLWCVGLCGPLLSRPARWLSGALYSRYKVPCEAPGGNQDSSVATYPLSAVNAETPSIHHSYLADDILKNGGTNFDKRGFDLDNALFFIHLCALVYEDECILSFVLRQWHLEYQAILSPDEGAMSQAWVVYHSTASCKDGEQCPRRGVEGGQDFIVVLFKGTSPFNFTEWMTDCTMSKIKPHGEYLPGMVHEGFYTQFQWPIYLREIEDEDGETVLKEPPLQSTEGFVCSTSEIEKRMGKNVDWDKDNKDHFQPGLTFYELVIRKTNWVIQTKFTPYKRDPAIWIAGHSLGAALASIFFSHLLHVPLFPFTVYRKALKGGYVFGSPRTGDSHYAKEINRHPTARHFFNVVNANDIVCTLPLGSIPHTQDPRLLTNFWHVGTPVLVNYGGSFEEGKRCGWSDFVFNAISYYIRLPYHVAQSTTKLLSLARLFSFRLFFFFSDHLPSEYINHLEACKKKKEDKSSQS